MSTQLVAAVLARNLRAGRVTTTPRTGWTIDAPDNRWRIQIDRGTAVVDIDSDRPGSGTFTDCAASVDALTAIIRAVHGKLAPRIVHHLKAHLAAHDTLVMTDRAGRWTATEETSGQVTVTIDGVRVATLCGALATVKVLAALLTAVGAHRGGELVTRAA